MNQAKRVSSVHVRPQGETETARGQAPARVLAIQHEIGLEEHGLPVNVEHTNVCLDSFAVSYPCDAMQHGNMLANSLWHPQQTLWWQ
jgi:hypothetical protein